MAKYTSTYSNDLSSAVAGYIGSTVGAAADDAHNERNRIEAEILAHNLKHPDRPFDPQFRKTHNILGHEIRGGDFLGSALMHRFMPNPLGLLGSGFHKKDFRGQAHLKGQSFQLASPVGPFPKPKAAWAAKMAGQPFANVAAGADLKHQVRSSTPVASSPSTSNTVDRTRAVKVHDEKLGGLMGAVALSLSASFAGINQKLDDQEGIVVAAKDGIAGTHKKLEETGSVLENKLDQIIAALRETVNLREDSKEDAKIAKKKEELKEIALNDEGLNPDSFVPLDDRSKGADTERINQLEEAVGAMTIEDPWQDAPKAEDGYSRIIKGSTSGFPFMFPMIGHGEEEITVRPINNNKYKDGEPRQGISQSPAPSVRNNITSNSSWNSEPPNITKLSKNIFESVVIDEAGDSKEAKEASVNLQKTMDVVPGVLGVVATNLLGKFIKSLGPVDSFVASSLKQATTSISSLFGTSNSATDNIVRGVETESRINEVKETDKEATKEKSNFFSSLLSIFGQDDDANQYASFEVNTTSDTGMPSPINHTSNTSMVGDNIVNTLNKGNTNEINRSSENNKSWNIFNGLFSGKTQQLREDVQSGDADIQKSGTLLNPIFHRTNEMNRLLREFEQSSSTTDTNVATSNAYTHAMEHLTAQSRFESNNIAMIKTAGIDLQSKSIEDEIYSSGTSEGTPSIVQLNKSDEVTPKMQQDPIANRVGFGAEQYYPKAFV